MYTFSISSKAESALKKGSIPALKKKERIVDDIEDLQENPLKRAKKTGNPHFGDYYVNCGNRYCMLFNINEDEKNIEILYVLYRPTLHKLLTGKIDGHILD